MAEEKKPKIDLKARLGKGGAQNVSVPTPIPGTGAPTSSPGGAGAISRPASSAAPRTPVVAVPPPGAPIGPPPSFGPSGVPIDASNPLAMAVTNPFRMSSPAIAPPRAQRIEVDETAVHKARIGARKQGLVVGLVAAFVFGAVGYVAGSAVETRGARQQSVNGARILAADVTKAHDTLKTIADKVEDGRISLVKERKFPESLAKELGALNVDFDGAKLAGIRFSGFPQDTSSNLIEFITSVQSVNDRKTAVAGMLTKLQKPITEQLSGTQTPSINYVVLLGRRDMSGNAYGLLAPLTKAIEVSNAEQIMLPAEFEAMDPVSRVTVKAPKYVSGNLDKPAAMYVAPHSLAAACPSETSGQIAQLGTQLAHLVTDIRGGQAAPGGDQVIESKPGMLDRANKLVAGLNSVH